MARVNGNRAGLSVAALMMGLTLASTASAQPGGPDCQECPPHLIYHYEGPPRFHFKKGCPRPICDWCNLPHYGYYQTCWAPSPFPPDWSHCPVPPPGATTPSAHPGRSGAEPPTGDEKGPPPRPLPMKPDDKKDDKVTPIGQAPMHGGEKPAWLPPPPMPALGDSAPPVRGLSTPYEPPVRGVETPATHSLPPAATPPEPPAPAPRLTPTPVSRSATPAAVPVRYDEPQRPRPVSPGAPNLRIVNSRRILLDYDTNEAAREGAVLELWFTTDGRRWMLDPTPVKAGAPHMVEVNREGTYGFSLLARPVHKKSQPPAASQAPQMWVEADWSGPTVELIDAKPTWGQQGRQVSVVWIANDNNLARQPINLAWAPTPDGPWQSIAAGIENAGRYVWQVPPQVQGRVHLRVEASDLLGNAGAAQTQSPVSLPPVQ